MIEQAEVQVKILRLNTGEDIIGYCLMDDEHGCVGIENPMKVFIKRANIGKSMLFILPWLPLEIIAENYVTINYDDIITMVEPKQSFIEYYNNTVEQIEAKELGEELGEEEDEVDEDTMQEMLNALRESKRNKLH